MSSLVLRSSRAVLLLAGLGCGGDDGGGDGEGEYFVALMADGTAYETATTGAISNGDGTITFAAVFDPAQGIGVSLTVPNAIGTYETGTDARLFITFNSSDNSFGAGGSRGSGTVMIDNALGDEVRGTFSFDAVSLDGTNMPIEIRDGDFGVEIVVD